MAFFHSSSLKLTNHTSTEGGPQRVSSRSLSWNSSGSYLALAGSDRMARIYTVEGNGTAREVLVVPHTAAVTKVRFRPSVDSQLVTAAADKAVRLWDVRGASQRSQGRIDLVSGNSPVTVEWCPSQTHLLSVTEQDGTVAVYDTRMLSAGTTDPTTSASTKTRPRPSALYSFSTLNDLPESCVFFPSQGNFLLVDSTANSLGFMRVWKYDCSSAPANELVPPAPPKPIISYPSHAPLYSMQFSPCGSTLATGGADATVGIWDVPTMCCRHVVPRHVKFIRSVAFSPDSKILASSCEEMIDLADTSNGAVIGQVSTAASQRMSGSRAIGAEEIAFHPSRESYYLLACARSDSPAGPTPLVILKLTVGDATQ